MHAANLDLKKKGRCKLKLTLRWTAGHESIGGNELADREAKMAAEGLSSDKYLLPLYVRKPLPINPAAIKRAHHDTLKVLRKKWWKALERGRRRDAPFDEATPSKKFLKTISHSKLSREDSSRITQLRIMCAPVNQYLNRIGRTSSARCLARGDELETVVHFMLRCPTRKTGDRSASQKVAQTAYAGNPPGMFRNGHHPSEVHEGYRTVSKGVTLNESIPPLQHITRHNIRIITSLLSPRNVTARASPAQSPTTHSRVPAEHG